MDVELVCLSGTVTLVSTNRFIVGPLQPVCTQRSHTETLRVVRQTGPTIVHYMNYFIAFIAVSCCGRDVAVAHGVPAPPGELLGTL